MTYSTYMYINGKPVGHTSEFTKRHEAELVAKQFCEGGRGYRAEVYGVNVVAVWVGREQPERIYNKGMRFHTGERQPDPFKDVEIENSAAVRKRNEQE